VLQSAGLAMAGGGKEKSSFPYDCVAEKALFLASKVVTKEAGFDDLAHNSQMIRTLELDEGARVGAGTTSKHLQGFPAGKPLGPSTIITNDHLCLHHSGLEATGGWKAHYVHYGSKTRFGHLILAGTLEHFRKWAGSGACTGECAQVPTGRLFAYVNGYIMHVDAQNDCASANITNGEGFIVYSNGNYYQGTIASGKKTGKGVFTFASGSRYEGEFRGGRIEGHGAWHYDDGTKYVGQFCQDKKHGEGTCVFGKSGNKYVGQYLNGKKHGQGAFTYKTGGNYVGEWKEDKKSGQGTLVYPNGSQYVGEFADNEPHGHGRRVGPGGTGVQEGQWVQGQFAG